MNDKLESQALKRWLQLLTEIEKELVNTSAKIIEQLVDYLPIIDGGCKSDVIARPADDWYDHNISCDVEKEDDVLIIRLSWLWGQCKRHPSECETAYLYRCIVAIENWREIIDPEQIRERIEKTLRGA